MTSFTDAASIIAKIVREALTEPPSLWFFSKIALATLISELGTRIAARRLREPIDWGEECAGFVVVTSLFASAMTNDNTTMDGEQTQVINAPLKVYYCGVCSLPIEYCGFSGRIGECMKWQKDNISDSLSTLQLQLKDEEGSPEKQKKVDVKKVTFADALGEDELKIQIHRISRGKTKWTTKVTGLGHFGIDAKAAAKFFASRFACGSSVAENNEKNSKMVVIQGNVADKLLDVIPEKWKQVKRENIECLTDETNE